MFLGRVLDLVVLVRVVLLVRCENEMVEKRREQSLDLEAAQELILKACTVLSSERTNLSQVVGRIAAHSHEALESLPNYDGSLRDGYAVGEAPVATEAGGSAVFQVIDEVAAGDTRGLYLGQGEAVRIMTGGLVPAGCQAVIPQENCLQLEEEVSIPGHFLQQERSFIHKKGSEIASGGVIVSKGDPVTVDQQILLAGAGYEYVNVVRKPKISFFCTGSELVTDSRTVRDAGQRFSANTHLLCGLIARHGALLQEQATVVDDSEQVRHLMDRMAGTDCDILLSTGGMGPGKFDLVEEAFRQCGGQTIYRSLHMRPGKSTLFGTLGKSLFFGLPGPPPAVQMLFHELLRPAICALQGARLCTPQKIEATLTEDLPLQKRGLLRLKSGVLSLCDGSTLVRPAQKGEVSNCYIFCSAARPTLRRGEKVAIHITDSPLASC